MEKKYIKLFYIELVIVICLMLLYFFVNSKYINLVPQCYIYNTTGLYCPSCGGTRCVTSLLSFEFIKAFYYHPIFFISIVLGIIINIYYIYTVLANKKFKLLKWWYVIIWISVLLIFAILRNKY